MSLSADIQPLLLINGRLHTMSQTGAHAEAVYIENGRFCRVGSTDEILKCRSSEARVIDLSERVVLPGLIDAHTHVELLTVSKNFWLDVREKPRESTLQV